MNPQPIERRDFLKVAAAGAAALGMQAVRPLAAAEAPRSLPPVLMHVGNQHVDDEATLRLLAAFGVENICGKLPSPKLDDAWSVDGLVRRRKRVESHGISLDSVPLPMSSSPIAKAEYPAILLGKEPERSRAIEDICQMIRNAGAAGIPMVQYNMTYLGVVRTGRTPGRGGASYSTFVYANTHPDPEITEAGHVSAAAAWDRIEFFLKRVVPVAEEARVKIALHPNDPGLPQDREYQGVHSVLSCVDGLKRFIDTVPSPYHGLNFCQGTVSEMLRKPGEEIYDVIRYFGSRGKIFNVHFRNISGGFLDFKETFPDNGDVDMLRALRTYREVGYAGMIMPDHVPIIAADEGSLRAFSFCYGYIQAALQSLRGEG